MRPSISFSRSISPRLSTPIRPSWQTISTELPAKKGHTLTKSSIQGDSLSKSSSSWLIAPQHPHAQGDVGTVQHDT